MKIKNLRNRIDRLDAQILKILNQRLLLSRQIGKVKQKRGQGVYAPEREKLIYQRLLSKNRGPLDPDGLKAIYREVISASRKITRSLKVAYLGPAATFTHLASLKKFGSSAEYVDCASITEIFNDVEKGRADYGVVPIENSIEGAVSHTLDMFIDSRLLICSEIYLEISHSLLWRI